MVSIFVCGDIVNYEHRDGVICSDELSRIIYSAELSVCNFEAPISGYGKPQPKSGRHHSQRPETIAGLSKIGFDLLLLANNHIMDYGKAGLEATLDLACEEGMETIGCGLNSNAAYRPLIKEMGGLKIGMVNACEAQFGVIDYFTRDDEAGYAWINHHRIDMLISNLKALCDFVIVFSHAGLEHYRIPQKEWRERYKQFCDLGADLVVGSHPHVPQGVEKYNESLIFYSLGNFYFDSQYYIRKEDNSFSVLFRLSRDAPIAYEAVFHHKENGVVRLSSEDKRIDMDDLCTALYCDYQLEHDRMSLETYEVVKQNLILSLAPIPFDGGLISSLRKIAARLTGKRKATEKELLLLHMLKNEAYYFAAKHSLELLVKKSYS